MRETVIRYRVSHINLIRAFWLPFLFNARPSGLDEGDIRLLKSYVSWTHIQCINLIQFVYYIISSIQFVLPYDIIGSSLGLGSLHPEGKGAGGRHTGQDQGSQ